MPTEISLLHIITDDYYHVIKDYEKDGDGAKKGGKKGGKASAAKADKKGGGKKSMKDGGKGGKKPKSKSKDNDSDDGGGGGGGGKKDREGWATDPKPKPIKPTIENPSLPDDKYGIERILKLVTCYEDPDYGGCTISGLLSSDMVLLMIKKTHLLDSVLNHPCTLVAKHEGRIIGKQANLSPPPPWPQENNLQHKTRITIALKSGIGIKLQFSNHYFDFLSPSHN